MSKTSTHYAILAFLRRTILFPAPGGRRRRARVRAALRSMLALAPGLLLTSCLSLGSQEPPDFDEYRWSPIFDVIDSDDVEINSLCKTAGEHLPEGWTVEVPRMGTSAYLLEPDHEAWDDFPPESAKAAREFDEQCDASGPDPSETASRDLASAVADGVESLLLGAGFEVERTWTEQLTPQVFIAYQRDGGVMGRLWITGYVLTGPPSTAISEPTLAASGEARPMETAYLPPSPRPWAIEEPSIQIDIQGQESSWDFAGPPPKGTSDPLAGADDL